MTRNDSDFEALNRELMDPAALAAYKSPYDGYRCTRMARLLGALLTGLGDAVYGKKPSYQKFRAVEMVARVPYRSWASVSFFLMTLSYTNEARARELSRTTEYAQIAQENETMHLVVISQLTPDRGFVLHTLLPSLLAFVYYVASCLLYLVHPRSSYELNYLFEQHAFDQYSAFLALYEHDLKAKPIASKYLAWYGRNPESQYDFFLSVRNDEIIHRNKSLEAVAALQKTASYDTVLTRR